VQWQEWFDTYRAFINHYATLAQENGVEQFCVGTELVGTSHREAEWRDIVAGASLDNNIICVDEKTTIAIIPAPALSHGGIRTKTVRLLIKSKFADYRICHQGY